MLYSKERSRAIRVPFTRMLLLRSPCEVSTVGISAVVSLIDSDATHAYRIEGIAEIEQSDSGVAIVCVARLPELLRRMYERVMKAQ